MKGSDIIKHILKVQPYSDAEVRLNNLIELTNNRNVIIVRLSELFNTPYNEYEFDDDVYDKIRNYLKEEKA